MTYLVNDKCIKCKLMDCVEVCPVDCFYEGKNMLVIKPDECIDCGVCEPECPVDAIISDNDDEKGKWLEVNKKYSDIWPNISEKKDPPADHEQFKDVKDKTADKSKREFSLIEVACLLIHASKIDQNYTEKEKEIVKKTLLNLDTSPNEIEKIIKEAEKIESDSNQILDFTKNLKNIDEEMKLIVIESLWEIIYSDNKSDMYEANLMRRLTGLLYLDPKKVGEIKERINLKNK